MAWVGCMPHRTVIIDAPFAADLSVRQTMIESGDDRPASSARL
jgi:hypothetical protein